MSEDYCPKVRRLLTVFLVACGARPDLSGPTVVSLVAQDVTITQGGPPVAIAIHLENAGTDEVHVDLPSLPLELSASPITIPPGVHDTTMWIRASREAEQGDVGLTVHAVTVHGEQRLPLDVYVRGCAGCLDTTYATNGVDFVPSVATLLVVDAADRAIVVTSTSDDAAVSRFDADGHIDPSFASIVMPGRWSAIASDGSNGVYIGGHDAIAHVSANGSLDVVHPDLLGMSYTYTSIVVTNDGFFVAGYDSLDHGVIAKLTNNTLDPSFGQGGVIRPGLCGSITSDGPMVIVTCDDSVLRLDAHGALDTTIAMNGQILAARTTVISDGRYLVTGYDPKNGGARARAAMFTHDGALDSSFGDGGFAVVDANIVESDSFAYDVAVTRDGKFLILGSVAFGESSNWSYIRRLNADGTTDTGFATNGLIIDGNAIGRLGLQSDDRFVVVGAPTWYLATPGFVARYWN